MENWKDMRVPYDLMELLLKIDEKIARLDLFRPFPSTVVSSIKESLPLKRSYNSNSIEGNTLSLRETKLALEEGLTVSHKLLNEYFEAVNHLEAIDNIEHFVPPDYDFRDRDILHVQELVMDCIDKDFTSRMRHAGV